MVNSNKDEIQKTEDGRNYFRLHNTIGVACFPVTGDLDSYLDAYDSKLQVPAILALLNQSRESQIDNNNLLKQIRSKNGNVGRYLERLNDRLDLLQKAILYIDHSFPSFSWQWLHYSEAGVDFLIPHSTSQHPTPLTDAREFSIDEPVHLILSLPSPNQNIQDIQAILPKEHLVYQQQFSPAGYISVLGRVISVEDETAALRIGCAFAKITDFDRQFLARHILAVQSFRRRQSLDDE